MKDKVLKYTEFLFESTIPSKGEIDNVLRTLKTKLEKLFGKESSKDDEVKKFNKKSESDTFEELGAELQSLELSKYTKITHTLKLKFSCEDESGSYLYDFLFSVNLENLKKKTTAAPAQGVAPAQGQAPATQDQGEKEVSIEICKVIVKKYDEEDFALLGQIEKDEVEIKDIDGKFLVEMKNEIDEKTQTEEEGEEEFEIVLK